MTDQLQNTSSGFSSQAGQLTENIAPQGIKEVQPLFEKPEMVLVVKKDESGHKLSKRAVAAAATLVFLAAAGLVSGSFYLLRNYKIQLTGGLPIFSRLDECAKLSSDDPRCSRDASIHVRTEIPSAAGEESESISAGCLSLTVQILDDKEEWVGKSDAEFSDRARPGDRVRFICSGSKSRGNFIKSAFFINGTLHVDDVVKLNSSQFAVEYTIPAVGPLKVESVLLHDSEGWVD